MNKKVMVGAIAAVVAFGSLMGCQEETKELNLESSQDRISYTMGYNLGKNFQQQEIEVNVDTLAAAMRDAYSDAEPKLGEEDMQAAMQTLQDIQQAKMEAMQKTIQTERATLAEDNLVEGQSFLEENAQREGVVVTESGLQYKVITEGAGEKPTADSTVDVHYRGTLINGTVFDSSYDRNASVQFGVTQVIPGWTQVLQLMPEGSKWQVFIPSDLAYGSGGAGADIGPNATLVFDIELVSANFDPNAAE